MDRSAFVVYRLRGLYYITSRRPPNSPTDLGAEIISDIPSDEEGYCAWKRNKVAHFLAEEKRIRKLALGNPTGYRSVYDFFGWIGRQFWEHISERDYYGYEYRPSRLLHAEDGVDWLYVIDLDEDVLRIGSCADSDSLYLNLKNIPRQLFNFDPEMIERVGAHATVFQTMMALSRNLSAHHFPVHLHTKRRPDDGALKFYLSCLVQYNLPQALSNNLSPLEALRLLQLTQFVDHFRGAFRDVSKWHKKSHFVFRQLIFGALNVARGLSWLEIPMSWIDSQALSLSEEAHAAPNWEPPASDIYWFNNLLVVLEERVDDIYVRADAISRAVQFLKNTQSFKSLRETLSVTAIILSSKAICEVNIRLETNETRLFDFGVMALFPEYKDDSWGREIEATQGMFTLLRLVPAALPPQARPACASIPAEILLIILKHVDQRTYRACRNSCRLLRSLCLSHPRIGDWTLVRHLGECEHRFVAYSKRRGVLRRIRLEPDTIRWSCPPTVYDDCPVHS